VTGQTAAEIIHGRVDAAKPNMGLTTWKNAPAGKILKTDVSVAKNYLQADEIAELNRVVTMYLDYAENQARRNTAMSMTDWVQKLDAFLSFNDYNTLKNAGTISHEVPKRLAKNSSSITGSHRIDFSKVILISLQKAYPHQTTKRRNRNKV
jgi:hypothetical protein